jgi:hypothetical protein
MAFKFNPFTGTLDIVGSSARSAWQAPVAEPSDLPLVGNQDGDARVAKLTDDVWVWDDAAGYWVQNSLTPADPSTTPDGQGVSITRVDLGDGLAIQELKLHPASGSTAGIVNGLTQNFSGDKTFNNDVNVTENLDVNGNTDLAGDLQLTGNANIDGSLDVAGLLSANGGVDVWPTPGATLSIGTQNAEVINIGSPSATLNLIGTVVEVDVTNLNVEDALITINNGGGVGSAAGAGIEIEEGGSPTGYVKVSADRNGMLIKAPNTAGEATIIPGASGITLNQSSHNPVTLGAVGSSPNANGASLSTQVLTLQPADETNPGVLSTGAQDIGGNKTLKDNLTVEGTTTLATALEGPLKATAGVVSSGLIDLESEVENVLPVANGGTNSDAALNNNRIMVSSGSAIVEAAALTDGQLLIGDTGGAPVAANLSEGSGIEITNGAGSIEIALTVPPSSGDISETSFTAANNQAAAADVTGLAFANGTVRSFEAILTVVIDATSDLFESFKLHGVQKGASWSMSQTSVGDDSGIVLSITNAGQVQYTSTDVAGFSSSTMKFRAVTTSV